MAEAAKDFPLFAGDVHSDGPMLATLGFAPFGEAVFIRAPRPQFQRASGLRFHGDGRFEVQSRKTGQWLDPAPLGFVEVEL